MKLEVLPFKTGCQEPMLSGSCISVRFSHFGSRFVRICFQLIIISIGGKYQMVFKWFSRWLKYRPRQLALGGA